MYNIVSSYLKVYHFKASHQGILLAMFPPFALPAGRQVYPRKKAGDAAAVGANLKLKAFFKRPGCPLPEKSSGLLLPKHLLNIINT